MQKHLLYTKAKFQEVIGTLWNKLPYETDPVLRTIEQSRKKTKRNQTNKKSSKKYICFCKYFVRKTKEKVLRRQIWFRESFEFIAIQICDSKNKIDLSQ